MSTRFFIILYAFGILLIPHLKSQPFRAAYNYGFQNAYSAEVDLPVYQIVNIGRDLVPIDINDRTTVLLREPGNRLLRWSCGEFQLLHEPFTSGSKAFLNEAGSIAALPTSTSGPPEILYWESGQVNPTVIPWSSGIADGLVVTWLYDLDDLDHLTIYTETLSPNFPLPPSSSGYQTNRLHLPTQSWEAIATYEYTIGMDFVLHQGGSTYAVHDSNNLGDTVGLLYSDSATTPPFAPEPIYAFQTEFFAYNIDTELDFEPLQINDSRTILGRTDGPLFGLIIVDQFGQRSIGPVLDDLGSAPAFMSNPQNGLEEIVVGNHYFKRMTERDPSGRPTGQASPDFWHGKLEDLAVNNGSWRNLQSTCMSANGMIAGTGEYLDPIHNEWTTNAFVMLPTAILPDWDRSGTIDFEDRQHGNTSQPYRFWVNDDNDAGNLSRSSADDLPGSDEPDWANEGMDGLRDSVDFFPVHIDLQPMLQSLGSLSGLEIALAHEDSALNFIYSDLLPNEAGKLFTGKLTSGFGPDFSKAPESAPTHPIGPDPVILDQAFLDNIRNENRGLLYMEGTQATDKPLRMHLIRHGKTILSYTLNLSISPVRDMFRIINLRQIDAKFAHADPGPWLSDTSDPPNLPDSYLIQFSEPLRTLIHVHGYNWGGRELPAAHSEVFKRFFQSGSHARYVGVSWFGDQGKLELIGTTFDYNENVANALITAPYLSEQLHPFSGKQSYLFAHSLGNMVASSAIVEHGLEIGAYFLVNAAVSNEAYLGEQDDRMLMVNPEWKDIPGDLHEYSEHLLAPNWFRLFPANDNRSLLGWKNKFSRITDKTICLNFYSSGEDILAPGSGRLPALFDEVWKQEQIWTYNEMQKGTNSLATSLTGDTHGGWGFNTHYMDWRNPGGPHPPSGYWTPMPPTIAQSIFPESIINEPFFRKFSSSDSDFPSWGDGEWVYEDRPTANAHLPSSAFSNAPIDTIKNHAKILAEAIPAHSAPAGSTPLPNIQLLRNIDMDAVIRKAAHWPVRDQSEKQDRWLHSDYLKPALSHVYGLYRECVQLINYLP